MKLTLYLSVLSLAAPLLHAQNPALSQAEAVRREAFDPGWTPGIYPAIQPTLGQDDEVFLLQESQPFFVRATSLQVYTTNAFYDFTEQADWYFKQDLDIGAETIIAERFYVLAEVGASLTRYNDLEELDREGLNLRLATSYALSSRSSIGLAYTGSWFQGEDFSDGGPTTLYSGGGSDFFSFTNTDSTFHALSLTGNFVRPLPSGNTFQLSPILTRIWADPSDYNQTAVGIFTSVVAPMGEKTSFGLTGRADYIWYDSYFESLFENDRKDLTLSAGAYVAYQPSKNVELRLGAMFTNNDSTLATESTSSGDRLGLYDYSSWNFVPTLRMSVHF